MCALVCKTKGKARISKTVKRGLRAGKAVLFIYGENHKQPTTASRKISVQNNLVVRATSDVTVFLQ